MNAAIEEVVKQCKNCQESCPSPAVAPLHPWEWPPHPWQRLHLDIKGPFLGHMFLVLVGAHSKVDGSTPPVVHHSLKNHRILIIFPLMVSYG